MSDSAPLFELDGVSYAYRNTPGLDGLDLTVRSGERLALVGANGSGKSTLLKLLAGLIFADHGSVRAFDEALDEDLFADEDRAIAFRRRVGLVFQNPDIQLFSPTVFDELAFGPLQLGWPPEEIRSQITATLERFEIAHLGDRAPHRLSGGEKKRVALACVLISEPQVLLLDEPTAALDPQSADAVVAFLQAERSQDRTIVLATHDLDRIEAVADRVVVLDHGKIVASGSPGAILDDTALLARSRLLHTRPA
ncbi:energy-coupling factor ABC transporter ATP-binding protein [Pararhizobium mangrovi]|uniref:ABC transporter ATP-binding protein n=1 Tax=Pararhizobium mangrovi TaxID=2590452 RepID=A0A506U0E1_9HYPH|nr:ABC transporter ATP-binding protein [Pararhizobium mangrovi]TPW26661.1 ABC transporter ATP-binding protein [Pararhizobium mangrovi]